jgi:hypothetical protein
MVMMILQKVYILGFEPLLAKDIANVKTRPAHVSINEMLIISEAQASETLVNRNILIS